MSEKLSCKDAKSAVGTVGGPVGGSKGVAELLEESCGCWPVRAGTVGNGGGGSVGADEGVAAPTLLKQACGCWPVKEVSYI